ncbi:hypothetical protein J8273_5820 [Carpediemonas membranifera]|uniref:Uncharacterized protein n=1 Tax=Carpediemonas membranifera TaxID=201153 RepID=A0A8J6ASA3_9EUKA|nr:hypothetical protein J8273_5820 [Carpediemonas membranifera]|eukprot:KAG9392788.1 hypothetical protein J8273_5820 [Carpediemonas membranifera]
MVQLPARFSYHVSLKDIGTSSIVPLPIFLAFRTISVVLVLFTVALGIYTRRAEFFVQFTNQMMLVSLAYMISAWIVTYRYIRCLLYGDVAQDVAFFEEPRPSRLAKTTWILFQVAFSTEVIVTSVFWLLLLDEFNTEHGLLDWIYGVCSHGAVLGILVIELLTTKIRFVRLHHSYVTATLTLYVTIASVAFYRFNHMIYFFCDLAVPIHRVIVMMIFLMGAVCFELGRLLCLLRDFILQLLGINIVVPVIRKHKKLERLPIEEMKPRIVRERRMPDGRVRAHSFH